MKLMSGLFTKGSIMSIRSQVQKNVINCLKFSVEEHEISSMWLTSIPANSHTYFLCLPHACGSKTSTTWIEDNFTCMTLILATD